MLIALLLREGLELKELIELILEGPLILLDMAAALVTWF
jgi:hypothetical protein